MAPHNPQSYVSTMASLHVDATTPSATIQEYSENRTPWVQELFDGLRAEGRAVGIASVYRVLDQLADLRLVHRVDFGQGITRFEPAYPGGNEAGGCAAVAAVAAGCCGRGGPAFTR